MTQTTAHKQEKKHWWQTICEISSDTGQGRRAKEETCPKDRRSVPTAVGDTHRVIISVQTNFLADLFASHSIWVS